MRGGNLSSDARRRHWSGGFGSMAGRRCEISKTCRGAWPWQVLVSKYLVYSDRHIGFG